MHSIYTPHGSSMAQAGAQPLAIHRVPHIDHRVFGHSEKEVSFMVVPDLCDGPLMALQQDGLHPGGARGKAM